MDWPIYALMGLLASMLVGIPMIARRVRELQLHAAGLDHPERLTDEELLLHMARLMMGLGYRVRRGGAGESFDLVLTDGLGQQRGLLTRRWRSQVDGDVVTRAAEEAEALGMGPPMIVTIERFTLKAREAARAAGVILWSVPDLAWAIGQVKRTAMAYPDLPMRKTIEYEAPPIQADAAAAAAPEPEPAPLARNPEAMVPMRSARRRPSRMRRGERHWGGGGDVPFCPRCGKKMETRTQESGEEFWACPRFPRCLGSRKK